MKILQVNCVYHRGSTAKIMYEIHTELLKRNYESVICYGRGPKTGDEDVYKTCAEWYAKFNNLLSRFTGIMYGGCFFSTNKLMAIIEKENPDIVHLHCINGYFVNIYRLINWLKKNKIKTVLTLHAEFMHTANCGYALECENWLRGCGECPRLRKETKSLLLDNTALSWKKMKNAFDGFKENLIVVSVSDWLMNRAKQSPILADKNHTVVLNGVNTEVFKRTDSTALRNRLNIGDQKVALFVTSAFSLALDHIKGGYFVVEIAKRFPDVTFLVVGNKDGGEITDLPKNVLNIGRVDSQETLAEYYSMADVTLLPSKKETFSMVTAESLCCGTPVVGFKSGGPETIAIEEYCTFVDYADIDVLENVLKVALKQENDSIEIANVAERKYKETNMTDGYIKLYKKLLSDSKEENAILSEKTNENTAS